MDLRAKIADAVYDHPRADDQINAVMEVVETENYGIDTIMEQLRKDIEERRAQLAKLRALHTKIDGGVFVDKCICKGPWPCPTAEILEEA